MIVRESLDTLIHIDVSAAPSCFDTSGGSASSGRLASTREMRSRTSLAAPSMSRSRENSMVIVERSS